MNRKDYLKLELMVFAITHDYFGYGSQCYKRKDGKWVSRVDGEKATYTSKQLADEFDNLLLSDQKEIFDLYFETNFITNYKSLY